MIVIGESLIISQSNWKPLTRFRFIAQKLLQNIQKLLCPPPEAPPDSKLFINPEGFQKPLFAEFERNRELKNDPKPVFLWRNTI